MLTSNGHTVAGVLNKGLQFDPVKDFAGITPVASVPLVLIINPELPAKNLKELIDLAKAKARHASISLRRVWARPLSSPAPCSRMRRRSISCTCHTRARRKPMSVVRGDSQMYFTPANTAAELVQSGKVRALAVATDKRGLACRTCPP